MLDVIVSLLCDPDQVESIKPLYMRCSDFVKLTGVNQTKTKKYKRSESCCVKSTRNKARHATSSLRMKSKKWNLGFTAQSRANRAVKIQQEFKFQLERPSRRSITSYWRSTALKLAFLCQSRSCTSRQGRQTK